MVDLPDAQGEGWGGVSIGEGIEARPEEDILREAGTPGVDELILDEAGAYGQKRAEIGGGRTPLVVDRVSPKRLGVFRPEDRKGQRIVEHRGEVEQLMGSAPEGDSIGRAAGFGWDHWEKDSDMPPNDRE
jgi:hypothetical protein